MDGVIQAETDPEPSARLNTWPQDEAVAFTSLAGSRRHGVGLGMFSFFSVPWCLRES